MVTMDSPRAGGSRVDVASPAEWAKACSSAFVPLRVRSTSPRFRASLAQAALAPGVTLTRVSSGASEVYRSDRVIVENPRDDILVSLHRTGTGSVQQHCRSAAMGPGSAVLYDASAPYTLSFPGRFSELVVQFPRRAITRVGNAFDELTARPLPRGAPLRAFAALAASVDPTDANRSPIEDDALADALTTLLVAVLLSEHPASAPPLDAQLLLAAMRRYIEEHATDPMLSPDVLARAHHVSLRLVQKLFAYDDDSPAAYIRARRLRIARLLLVEGHTVAAAARRSGFEDVDTFSRAFKREFGVTPSSARHESVTATPASIGDPRPDAALPHRW